MVTLTFTNPTSRKRISKPRRVAIARVNRNLVTPTLEEVRMERAYQRSICRSYLEKLNDKTSRLKFPQEYKTTKPLTLIG